MSIECLHNPFLGFPLKGSVDNDNSDFVSRGKMGTRAFPKILCAKQNHGKCQGPLYSQFDGRKIKFPLEKLRPCVGFKMNSINEWFSES